MRAVVRDTYGPPDVLRLADVVTPRPKPDQVLIRVHATTVNRTDEGFLTGKPLFVRYFSGFPRPKNHILGTEVAGVVEQAGDAVHAFAPGNRVFGINAWNLGKEPITGAFGAHAEYVCMRESGPLAAIPDGVPFSLAAPICDGALLALWNLRAAGVRDGKRVLVYGATGSIGTAGVQLSRHFGAHVTAVCPTQHFDLVRGLGADDTIDYMKEDFTASGQRYDVIFDAVGKLSFRRCRNALSDGGVYVTTDGLMNVVLAQLTRRSERRVVFPLPPRFLQRDVRFMRDLMEAGEYRAVIDRTYPLDEAVAAMRYVQTGQKVGNVVLDVTA